MVVHPARERTEITKIARSGMELAFQVLLVAIRGSIAGNRFWLGVLYALYATLVLLPAGGWAPAFLLAGLLIILGLMRKVGARPRSAPKGPPQDGALSEAAAGLVFLLCVQHGVLQAKTELTRGNWVGAVLCLGVVTPILGGLGGWLVKWLSNRILGFP